MGRLAAGVLLSATLGGCGSGELIGLPSDGPRWSADDAAVDGGAAVNPAGDLATPGGRDAATGGRDLAAPLDLAVPIDLAVDDGRAPGDLAGPGARLEGGTFLFNLDAGAFPPKPGRPSVLVFVPPGFDPRPPVPVVVFLHGWSNCVQNVVRDGGAPCQPGGAPRQAYSLVAQLLAAGKRAILVVPELAFDQQTSDAGNLGRAGGFRALLGETLRHLAPWLGPLAVDDLGPLAVASHSGGYLAAAGIAARGGVPIAELYLLDSLYGATADFDGWIKGDLPAFAAVPPRRRFASVYTDGGGTNVSSQTMANRAAGWFPPGSGAVVDDRTTATWADGAYRHGLLFKRSSLSHDGVVRYYFGKLVATSSLP